MPVRLLAAADAYQAMTQERPQRPALAPDEAARQLRAEVDTGRLDRGAGECVLEAAGHARRHARVELPAGLSEREVEVLREICLGHSNRQTDGRSPPHRREDRRAPRAAHLQQDRSIHSRWCRAVRDGKPPHPMNSAWVSGPSMPLKGSQI